ncbi:MAG: hypothetical protein U0L05_03930 [Schaedlerella sp.]|nr:hypothetical protein [Schaedlerella sp.]
MISKNTAEILYTELTDYERHGIGILIDGRYASPMQVVKAMMVREAGSYMRDYEMNSQGNIKQLEFIDINKSKRRKSQP